MTFEDIINNVLAHEGGYVNDPLDKGGETNFGIAKRWYPETDIKALTKNDAVNIYYNDYWIPSKADQLPNGLKATYFDMCVNMGQTRAVKILQETINSVESTTIAQDGIIGSITINSASKVSKKTITSLSMFVLLKNSKRRTFPKTILLWVV